MSGDSALFYILFDEVDLVSQNHDHRAVVNALLQTHNIDVPDMTYNVFGGMFSLTQSINQSWCLVLASLVL